MQDICNESKTHTILSQSQGISDNGFQAKKNFSFSSDK